MKAGVKECSLTLNSLKDGDDEYLNTISSAWATYSELDRTSLSTPGHVVMNLKNTSTGEILSLNVPDFSGETFDQQFENREWTKDYHELVVDLTGLIIFIDPASNNNIAPTIMSEQAAINAMEEIEGTVTNAVVDEEWEFEDYPPVLESVKDTAEYNPRDSSNQVKLVEVLQFIEMELEPKVPIKVSVIVSAWDTVIETYGAETKPEKLVKDTLPLLCQYLECNQDIFTAHFFGISAQGGTYSNIKELIKKPLNKRVIVYSNDAISEDIVLPITSMTE